ncbi:ABC transporter permease [Thalassobacillus pellis]|uniref:ABC transporter permease n=1 Tax=Thalassobacillus pellis TaxID=748008 RepID=UPI0019618CBB|nr:ABC transporter permease [Thalassobacillus pellis]MBM7552133.1 bacitracin transport system permease protein [Thalassobacillus pellis]
MNTNQLILRNLHKNIKNYYLYVFALIFSTALYFAFVTLQYDPAMDETTGSIKGAAAVRVASVLLIAIVAIFLIYANNLFIKRRSKEIGLFQLIGMTKNRIFLILSMENFLVYFGSLLIGTLFGFAVSKLIMMILFKIMGIDQVASLSFSIAAFLQTVGVFTAVYLIIMLVNYLYISRQTILSLFHIKSKTEAREKRISIFEVVIGLFGIGLIALGYYVSSRLFSGDFTSIQELFTVMLFILVSVIIGTYLFYKGSVRFLANLIRKNKGGYLNINQVLSLSSIMFRMKSNALLLTIITTVSALAIGLLSLSYISYYSAGKTAESNTPADFSFVNEEDLSVFTSALKEEGIPFNKETIKVLVAKVKIDDIVNGSAASLPVEDGVLPMPIVSDASIPKLNVGENQILFTGYSDAMKQIVQFSSSGTIVLHTATQSFKQQYMGLAKEDVLSGYFTKGRPTVVVDKALFEKIAQDLNKELQFNADYAGINVQDEDIKIANDIFQSLEGIQRSGNSSQFALLNRQKENMGLIMFIVGFLGLTFLITSGCILYFKQMDEGDEERPNYTILRKLGYTRGDLLKGIQGKQVFNFGIPLIIGLFHSYFAVQSGWFLFGTELWAPMFIVMGLYAGLYSIFGVLSVLYYKKVIRHSL